MTKEKKICQRSPGKIRNLSSSQWIYQEIFSPVQELLLLSIEQIARRRIENRAVLTSLAKDPFLSRMLTYLSLHGDGKLMSNFNSKLKEMEAILVCGSPDFEVGKLISKVTTFLIYFSLKSQCIIAGIKELTDAGRLSSTRSIQAEAIYQKILDWTVEDRITAMVFDTTASNMGKNKGTKVHLHKLLSLPSSITAADTMSVSCWSRTHPVLQEPHPVQAGGQGLC